MIITIIIIPKKKNLFINKINNNNNNKMVLLKKDFLTDSLSKITRFIFILCPGHDTFDRLNPFSL